MEPTIKVYRLNGRWQVDFEQAIDAAQVLWDLGTHVVTAPFRDTMPTDTFIGIIQKKNPGHKVLHDIGREYRSARSS